MGLLTFTNFPLGFDPNVAAPDTAGAGGPTQANKDSMVFGQSTLAFPLGFDPNVAAPDTAGAGGPTQANKDSMVFGQSTLAFPLGFDPNVAAPDTAGAGGPTQANKDSMVFGQSTLAFPLGFDIGGTIIQASFTWSIPDPIKKPFTVKFNATGSSGGGSPFEVAWSFGDGSFGPDSLSIEHVYAAFDTYTVTLIVTQQGGLGLIDTQQQVVVVADTRPQPAESDDEVLNRERGHHAYEPVRTTGSSIDPDSALRVYDSEAITAADEQDVLSWTADRPVILSHIRVGGDCDGRFRVRVDGVDIMPARRLHHSQQGEDLLDGARIVIEEGQVVTVRALNLGEGGQGTYEATLVGATA